MSELDLKRTEVMRLSTDYEVKMKKKEVFIIPQLVSFSYGETI